MIKLQNLKARQGTFDLAIDSLMLEPGEFTAILGNNGSGKSTFLSVVAGFLPFSGGYSLDNKEFKEFDPSEINKQISYLPQKSSLNMPFEVQYVVLTGRYALTNGYRYSADDVKATEAVMETHDIQHLKNRLFNELSGGEKQRVLLARTLNKTSTICLLDEPLNGIDIRHQHETITLLKQLTIEKTILVVIHDISLAIREFDRFIVFSEGNLAYDVKKEHLDTTILNRIFNINMDFVKQGDKIYVYTGMTA